MDTIRMIITIFFYILGIVLGLYVGFWVMFVGGIWDIVQMTQESVATKMGVFGAVLKIIFAGFVGWLIAFTCFAIAKVAGDGL